MIQRQHLQRSIFETAIGSIEKFIDGLIEPPLQRLDEVLADEQLLEAVLGRLAQRWSQSCTRGRPGAPAELVLRMLVLSAKVFSSVGASRFAADSAIRGGSRLTCLGGL